MKRKQRLMEEARAVSLASDFKRIHMGCVIAYKGKVIASGCNSAKTHSLQKKYNIYRMPTEVETAVHAVHAETSAITHFLNYAHRSEISPRDCVVYVYREYKDGTSAMARPCPSCMRLLKDVGFRHVVYTTPDGIADEKITRE